MFMNVMENEVAMNNPETLLTFYTLHFRKIEEIFKINK